MKSSLSAPGLQSNLEPFLGLLVQHRSGHTGHLNKIWLARSLRSQCTNIARCHSRCWDYKATKSQFLPSRMSQTHLRHNKRKTESHTHPCLLTQLMGHLTPPVPCPKTKGSVCTFGFSLWGWQQRGVWTSQTKRVGGRERWQTTRHQTLMPGGRF